MNDNINANTQAQTDNLQADAVNSEAPQNEEKRMLAGKFEDRNGLEKSTLEIFKSVEGREPTAAEKLALKSMGDDTLESYYQDVQSDFTRMRQAGEEVDPEEAELKAALKNMGFVSKDELDRQKYEEEQLNLYLAQDPTAKSRVDLIKQLAQTPGFEDKTFAQVDAFIKKNAGIRPEEPGNAPTKPSVMGGASASSGKSPLEMSDEDFLNQFSGGGDLLSKQR
jgi:hypothetical protein